MNLRPPRSIRQNKQAEWRITLAQGTETDYVEFERQWEERAGVTERRGGAPWTKQETPSTIEMMQAYNQRGSGAMVDELRAAAEDPYDYFGNQNNELDQLIDEYTSEVSKRFVFSKPEHPQLPTEAEELAEAEEFARQEFGLTPEDEEAEALEAEWREEFGETPEEVSRRKLEEWRTNKRAAAAQAEAETIAPATSDPIQETGKEVQWSADEHGTRLETEIDTGMEFGESELPGSSTYVNRVVGDLLLAESQGNDMTPSQELVSSVDDYLGNINDPNVDGMSLAQRIAWETKQSGVQQVRNEALITEVNAYLDGLEDVETVDWGSDQVYQDFMKALDEEAPKITAAPAEYMTNGWDSAAALVTEKIDVTGISAFDEMGVASIEIGGVDPESVNPQQIAATLEEMDSAGTLKAALKWTYSAEGARYFATLGASALAGMGLQAAIHNDDQWILLNAAAGVALGPVGAASAIVSSAVTKYGIDYFRRQTEWAYETDQSKNLLAYIRYGDKWVPAIVTDVKEPTEAATALNAYGKDQNWEGAATLMVHTGY